MEAAGRRCDAKILTDERGVPIHSMAAPVGGFSPADLQSAYGLPTGGGAGRIVAIFGGGSDYANAESDLAVYRAQYGLPPCTAASGCFLKIDEHGGTNYPAAGTDEVEQALDMEMVSAACPACKVMLVEGGDLDVARATVIAQGASAFSFSILYSYGSDADNGAQCQNLGYNDLGSGLLVTAAMGDNGYPSTSRWVPAACQGTLAIGGTSLKKVTGGRGWEETTWSGTGSGCGSDVDKPAWQNDPSCPKRMAGDVSAVADPYTGVSFYGTVGASGWGVIGGTSAATPLTAGALTALGIANGHFSPAWVWQNPVNFYDVTAGNNGTCDGGASYLCTAGPGYDGPTGWGTPNGALLLTALPPGVAADAGACTLPAGSYAQSCTTCIANMRTSGCALTCQSCTRIDGTQAPGPSLGLPCPGSVENRDGTLVCDEPPDAGGVAVDAGASSDSGAPDATAPAVPGPVAEASTPGIDAALPDIDAGDGGGTSAEQSLPGAAGCGCTTTGAARDSASALVASLALISVVSRRRRRERGVRQARRASA